MSAVRSLECTCGAVLQVRFEHAGPDITCWRCGRQVTIPKSRTPAPAGVIRVTCQCGKSIHAHPSLADKRVKCPGCGRALTVPIPTCQPLHADTPREDPLGVGTLAQQDPLGIGDAGALPSSPLGVSPTLAPQRLPLATAMHASGADERAGQRRVALRDCAGWVAMCFGGYQTVTSGLGLANAYRLFLKYGNLGASPARFLGYVLAGVICLVLGICLTVLGFQIVRRVNARQSLERAGQVSMVYIGLFILGLVLSAMPLMRLFARSPVTGITRLVQLAFESIEFIPPAFIIFVYSRKK